MKSHNQEKKFFALADRGGDLTKQWYIHFLHEGKRKRLSGNINQGTTAKERYKLAERYIAELSQQYTPAPPSEKYHLLLYAALEFDRPQLRKKSYQTYKSKLDLLFAWLGDQELTTDALRRFLDAYRKQHTQTGTYDCRRMLMTYFKKSGIEHLLKPIKIKKGTYQPLRYFQPHQCEQLLSHLGEHDPQLHLHCLFIYYTALRPRAELRMIRISDIFFSDRKIAIRGEYAKNWRSEYIGIPERFLPVLEHLKRLPPDVYVFPSARDDRKPIGRNTLGERFRAVLDQFGYGDDYQLYSWKHTGAVAVYKATKNIYALKKHLRHKDIQTTELYIRQLGLSDFGDFYQSFPAPGQW